LRGPTSKGRRGQGKGGERRAGKWRGKGRGGRRGMGACTH